jgi:Zn-dependent protease with chaperone function
VRAFQLRLFLSALLPILLYLALSSLVARDPALRVRLEQVGLLGGLWTIFLLVTLVLFLPFFLRHAWDTAQLEAGGLRSQLEDVARRAGYRWRELLVWHTGQQMANAVIVGFTARTRLVLFSDLLLAQLGPRELAAVFAHEMGHARRGHAAVFAAFALTFFLAADLLVAWSGITSTLATLGGLLLVLVLWYLAFGFLSRRFELEADLESLRVLGESGPLVRALELVTGAHAHQRSSWRHFSTKDRVAFLQGVERDPVIGLKLRLALLRWRRLSFALFGLVALLECIHLARSWDEDWVLADLRLGRYEQAGQRAERGDVAPDTAALAQLAASLPGEARTKERLEERALQALARGDLERTRGLLGLAVLRGADELDPVWTALDRHLAGEDPGVSLEEFPETWRNALAERAR